MSYSGSIKFTYLMWLKKKKESPLLLNVKAQRRWMPISPLKSCVTARSVCAWHCPYWIHVVLIQTD